VSRNPLFDVLLVVQNHSDDADLNVIDGVEIEPFHVKGNSSLFDLSFGFIENNGKLEFALEYNTDLFSHKKAETIGQHFEQLLVAFLNEPKTQALKTSMLTENQKGHLLEAASNPQQHAGSNVSVVELFRRQAKFLPKSIALEYGERKWTYAEVDEITDQLAGFLIDRFGIVKDNLFAIEFERSEWIPISQMAIMKAGGAFLPIDPAFPEERKSFILADSGATAFIQLALIEEFLHQKAQFSSASLPAISSSQLAYCLYTSGSTGLPKGVLMDQGDLASRLLSLWMELGVGKRERFIQLTNFTFDVSLVETILPWIGGAAIVMAPPGLQREMPELCDFLIHKKITHLNGVPSLLSLLLSEVELQQIQDHHLVRCIAAGEALPLSLVKK